ncbi:hypothetical protein [Acetobacter estunensis]|uniref:AAA family ATPase n=1 Tax=Acetobacter estunensis TaxID=104097 RepID=UPI001C2DBD32|nr:hypothetical protein [Acetobacter estunensis]MBV1837314.1 hypothetical protein [Acetobacter estunensis]
MSGMILTSFEVEQVRRFGACHRLDGLGPGLNLLAAPNEAGKSTLLAALRALFLLRFGSKTQAIRDLAPRDGGSPRIRAGFTLGNAAYCFEKRFLTKAFARLNGEGRTLEGDDAEAQINDLLGLDAAKRGEVEGLLSTLWVGQTQSFTPPELSEASHRTIQSCLAADLDEITGGAEAGRILARVRSDLAELVDGRRKPKGRYADAIEGEEAAIQRLRDLENRRAMLEHDIADLDQCTRLLTKEADPARQQRDQSELEKARAQRDALMRFATRVAEGKAAVQEAQRLAQRWRDERARRLERRTTLTALGHRRDEVAEAERAAQMRLTRAETVLAEKRAQLAQAEERLGQAAHATRTVEQQVERLRLREQRDDVKRRLERLERLRDQVAQTRAALGAIAVNEAKLRELTVAERAVETAQAALQAQATVLDVTLDAGASARVMLDGKPLADGRINLLDPAELRIEGVGVFRIAPAVGDRAKGQAALDRARHAFEAALASVKCADMVEVHATMERRRQLAVTLGGAEEALKGTCAEPGAGAASDVEGVMSHLRERLAACDAGLTDGVEEEGLTAEMAQARLMGARAAALEAEQAVAAARQAVLEPDGEHRLAERLLTERRADSRTVREQMERLAAEDEMARGEIPDADLDERLDRAQQALDQAERALARLDEERPDGSEALLDASIQRLEERISGSRQRLADLQQRRAALLARVQATEGEGLDETIDATRRERDRHCSAREACEREVGALRLLARALEEAERSVTERYLAPLTRAVQPAIEMLFPRAATRFGTDFTIEGLERGRGEETLDSLSDGTREQISVLVRLGLADLLLARGRPAMLVLDDALCFSDAARLETMFNILAEASRRMQIIVMTCRAEAFSPLSARELRLSVADMPA